MLRAGACVEGCLYVVPAAELPALCRSRRRPAQKSVASPPHKNPPQENSQQHRSGRSTPPARSAQALNSHVVLSRFVGCAAVDESPDNRVKPALDYLQRIEVIVDDNQVRDLHVSFGGAPVGCRICVTPLP